MRHAARLDPERAAGWLHTVVKHEALAINRSRRRIVGFAEVDLDALESRTSASPEERVLAADRVARSAEALHGLKPQEVRALWLKALGHSYEQICEATGWTYTKVNRCLAEGRKSFLERYAGIESGQECQRLAPHAVGLRRRRGRRGADRRAARAPAPVPGLPGHGARAARRVAAARRRVPGDRGRGGQRRRRAHGQLLRARVRDGLAAPARARGELVPARAGGLRHRHGRQDGRGGGVGRGGRGRRLRRRGRRHARRAGDRPAAILRGAAGGAALPALKTASRRTRARQRERTSAASRPQRARRPRAARVRRAKPARGDRGAAPAAAGAAPRQHATTTTRRRGTAAARRRGLRRARASGSSAAPASSASRVRDVAHGKHRGPRASSRGKSQPREGARDAQVRDARAGREQGPPHRPDPPARHGRSRADRGDPARAPRGPRRAALSRARRRPRRAVAATCGNPHGHAVLPSDGAPTVPGE